MLSPAGEGYERKGEGRAWPRNCRRSPVEGETCKKREKKVEKRTYSAPKAAPMIKLEGMRKNVTVRTRGISVRNRQEQEGGKEIAGFSDLLAISE